MIEFYDHDTLKSDEIVGSMIFNLKDLINKGSIAGGYYSWENLYGAPKGYSGTEVDKMNSNPEFASTWLGRCLMHIEASDSKQPERKVQAC